MARNALWTQAAVATWILLAGVTQAGETQATTNWPTWRGPGLTGLATTGNPPITFSETKNLKWKIALPGSGDSTPVVWGDQIIFQSARAIQNAKTVKSGLAAPPSERKGIDTTIEDAAKIYAFDVVSVSLRDGKILWQTTLTKTQPHEGHHRDHGYASFSPVTDGKHIWVNFGSRGVYCLDMKGKVKWSCPMPRMKTRRSFGEASSPTLAGENLIVIADQESQSMIYALDKTSGEILWKKGRQESTNWTSPVAVKVKGVWQVLVAGTNFCAGYDAKTGKVLWRSSQHTVNVIPTPLVSESLGLIYFLSGFRGSMVQAVKIGETGSLSLGKGIAWENKKYAPYVPSGALAAGKLFYLSSSKAQLTCVDARTGKPHYQNQRLKGEKIRGVYASITGLEDRLYIASRDGGVAVVKVADTFQQLAANALDDHFDASPAIVGNCLILKGEKNLYCFEKAKK